MLHPSIHTIPYFGVKQSESNREREEAQEFKSGQNIRIIRLANTGVKLVLKYLGGRLYRR